MENFGSAPDARLNGLRFNANGTSMTFDVEPNVFSGVTGVEQKELVDNSVSDEFMHLVIKKHNPMSLKQTHHIDLGGALSYDVTVKALLRIKVRLVAGSTRTDWSLNTTVFFDGIEKLFIYNAAAAARPYKLLGARPTLLRRIVVVQVPFLFLLSTML
ncbi:hypothetical protein R1sor_011677 [Riccia sorocarpa]|uniref:Uncharacterized protein n=1 Tax=Riccia sorocarpa TaxID=122646 RepID=A0ABD3I5W4_9MARC